jgi:phosphopantetheinyl transferase
LVLESCVPVKKRCDVQIWRAGPGDVDHAQWRSLTNTLSLAERSKALEFRFDADRKAYVLAHGLRRLALAAMLDVQPDALVFQDAESGQPQLIKPNHKTIYYSHSHTREAVLFAASFDAAVGVDVERVAAEPADFTQLAPFMVWPEVAESGAAPLSFFHCWTALEAFWKAAGTGLSTEQPRLQLCAHSLGHFEVSFETPHDFSMTSLAAQSVIFQVTSPPSSVASLALIRPASSGDVAYALHEQEWTKDAAR